LFSFFASSNWQIRNLLFLGPPVAGLCRNGIFWGNYGRVQGKRMKAAVNLLILAVGLGYWRELLIKSGDLVNCGRAVFELWVNSGD
jgi:hypothetical protein